MENVPFEDAFPIENGDIPASYVSLPEGIKMKMDQKGWFSLAILVDLPRIQETTNLNYQLRIMKVP